MSATVVLVVAAVAVIVVVAVVALALAAVSFVLPAKPLYAINEKNDNISDRTKNSRKKE